MPAPSRTWTITANSAQPRLARDRLAALFQSSRKGRCGADFGLGQGWTFWPASGLITLAPARLEPEWWAQNSGRWAKLGLGGVSVSGGSWVEGMVGGSGDLRLFGSNAAAATLTLPAVGANTGCVFGVYAYGPGSARYQVATLTYPGSPSVAFSVWSDGTVDVLVGGAVIESQSVGGSSGQGGEADGRWFDLIVLPCRLRQILVFCASTGEGFVATRRDLPAGVQQTVLPAGQPVATCHAASQCLQLAPVRFRPSGTVYSEPLGLAEPPTVSGETAFDRTYWFVSGGTGASASASLAELDGSAFTPDGAKVGCRVKVELAASSDGMHSPQLLAAVAGFSRRTHQLPADESDLMGWVERATLSVRPDGTSDLAFEAAGPWPASGSPWTAVGKVAIGGHTVLEGDIKIEAMEGGPVRRWRGLIPDPSSFLPETPFRDPVAFDGQTLGDALRFCAGASGYPTEVDPYIGASQLPAPEGPEPALAAEVGDTPDEWIRRLRDTFACEAIVGFCPGTTGYKWRVRVASPGSSPVMVFAEAAAAKNWLSTVWNYTDEEAEAFCRDYTARSFSERRIPAEATEVRVIGWDWSLGAPVQAVGRATSLTSASAPGSRPDGWLGRPKPLGVFEPSLRSAGECEAVLERLFPLVARERRVYEIACGPLVHPGTGLPLWFGDAVLIEWIGVCLIVGFELTLVRQESGRGWRRVEARYTLEDGRELDLWGPRTSRSELWAQEAFRRWYKSGRSGNVETVVMT